MAIPTAIQMGMKHAAGGQQVQLPDATNVHSGNWEQNLVGCSPGADCAYSLFCPQCAHAEARAEHDNSSCFFHCCTSPPCLTYNVMRHNYGLGSGQDCHEDICTGLFCVPCGNRRAIVEARGHHLGEPHKVTTNTLSGNPRLFLNGTFTGRLGVGQYEFGSGKEREWLAGGLGDFSMCSTSCCYACLMPQCASARTRSYLDGSDCMFNVCATTPFQTYYMVRHYYGIRGEPCMDCCTVMFCMPCAIDRAFREVVRRNVTDAISCCSGPSKGKCCCC
eukprot:TRINITY_DN15837_c0_g2_i1.p2 TRINITY_DN15837_c0_g2~~TRINITY_DN15837_c0_g2_i1.p2  ORF type:complete len:308 (+),score=83.74 TRINITY_DN15837_c0_g2_i1:98-925(+)